MILQEVWARHKPLPAHLPECWAAWRQSHCSGDAEQRAADASPEPAHSDEQK